MKYVDKSVVVGGEIFAEVRRATTLYPQWPTYRHAQGRIEQAAIVAEEAGEVVQVALNSRTDDPHFRSYAKSLYDMRVELIQTAAMAMRALIMFPTLADIAKISGKERR